MPHKDPQARREYIKKYYTNNPDIFTKQRQRGKIAKSQYNSKYYINSKDERLKSAKQYRLLHAAKISERKRLLKIEMFNAYGGAICCRCNENRLGALTLDHINQDGAAHRKTINQTGGTGFYYSLRRTKFPSGYRVLCMNCNIISWLEHVSKTAAPITEYYRKRRIIEKFEFMSRLGSKCVKCGIDDIRVLTVHHINNDGADHRRKISKNRSGYYFYRCVLKINDFSGLECRCFSCNSVEEWIN